MSICGWLLMDMGCYPFFLLLHSIFFMGLVTLFFRSDREKRILAAAILLIDIRLVGNLCGSFLSCLALIFRRTVMGIPDPLLTEWEAGLISCISYCLVIFAVCRMAKYFEPVFHGKPGKWYAILAVPLLVIIAVFDVASWGASNGIMVRSGGSMSLYYDQVFSHAGFMVLELLSISAAVFYVFGMNRICLEQEKSGRYHSQIAVYKMLTDQYRQSERLRHDMKNHIIALSALSRNKEWEKLERYLKNMEDIVLDAGGDVTGNKAVDALLYQKRRQAEEGAVQWECDVQMPKGYHIDEFDLCVLFGNILDNALEACGRMRQDECRFINIRAKTVKKCFLIEIKNSMDRTEKYTEGFTGREDPREHGIGLLNVSDVVNKYNGAVHIEAAKGTFVTAILIPLNDAAHDIKPAV